MPQRACDRCHSIRARCQFHEDQDGCERCLRLGHSCTSLRKEKRPGRPRKNTLRKDDNASKQPEQSGNGTFEDLDPWEVQLAVNFLQNQRFENSFVSDSELSSSMQSTPIRLFLSAPGRVKDALLALAGVLASQGSLAPTNDADAMANMDRCCKAMERLRQTDVSSLEDAKATLFVATSLISFNDMTLGHGFLPVARAALLSVKPWYEALINTSPAETDPHLIPVLFAEISECVRCCEVPTFRYGNPPAHVIDPSYGVAQELLTYLYDFCVLQHDFKAGALNTPDALGWINRINDEIKLCDLELFRTLIQLNDTKELTENQRDRILRHALCYRMMVQLLLKQFQASIGDITDQSTDLARELRSNIGALTSQTEPQIQYVLFPYFVACAELEDEGEQRGVLSLMENLSGGIATQSCNRMFEFLQHVWATRKVDATACWLNLVDDGIQFSVGP